MSMNNKWLLEELRPTVCWKDVSSQLSEGTFNKSTLLVDSFHKLFLDSLIDSIFQKFYFHCSLSADWVSINRSLVTRFKNFRNYVTQSSPLLSQSAPISIQLFSFIVLRSLFFLGSTTLCAIYFQLPAELVRYSGFWLTFGLSVHANNQKINPPSSRWEQRSLSVAIVILEGTGKQTYIVDR